MEAGSLRHACCSVSFQHDKPSTSRSSVPVGEEQNGSVMGGRSLDKAVERLEGTSSTEVDLLVYASLIKRCGNAKALSEGRRVHIHVRGSEHSRNSFLMNLLLEMYGKCESLEEARWVFDGIQERNMFSWTIMISAYAQNGHAHEALKLLQKMDLEGVKPNGFTFVSILDACSSVQELQVIHARVRASSLQDVLLGTVLVNAYGKCGSLQDAREVFEAMPERNVVSWNAIAAAYAQGSHGKEALRMFHRMDLEGIRANKITFIHILSACTSAGALAEGKLIHERIVACGLEADVVLGNTLLNMYGKCRSLEMAKKVFDRIGRKTKVSWTAMITAYTQNGYPREALELFKRMDTKAVKPDRVIFVAVLDACATEGDLAESGSIHESAVANGFESDLKVSNSLVNMYAKCGSLENARIVFDKLRGKNVVSWNTMIAAYAQCGHVKDALELFHRMDLEGVKPDKITFVSVLEACAAIGALREGQRSHARIAALGFDELDTAVCNSILNMYGKCGSMENASRLFDKMHGRNQISWTCIIAGYAQHGHDKEALELYLRMGLEGTKPNQITFLGILIACNHAGLLDDGIRYFMSMVEDYGIKPVEEHYGCVIDLLGRAGWLAEAEDLITSMPFESCAVVWTTLLGACGIHRDVDRAEGAAARVFEKDPHDAGPYVLLSNIYAAAGRWDDVARVRKIIDGICSVKETNRIPDDRRRKLQAFRELEQFGNLCTVAESKGHSVLLNSASAHMFESITKGKQFGDINRAVQCTQLRPAT